MSELSFLAIAIGGGCGSVARFLVAREMGHWLGNFLPYGTLVVNVLGFTGSGLAGNGVSGSSGNQ